jgi:hypothetical protein
MSGAFSEGPDEKLKPLVIEHYGDRYFALYEGETLICVTVYRRGAAEVKRRLEATQNLIQKQTE